MTSFKYNSLEDLYKKAKEMMDTMGIIRCPHCKEFVQEGEYCTECMKSIENGIPVCLICKNEKVYWDKADDWRCPFCEL